MVKIEKSFPVPDDLKDKLAIETDLVHSYVESGERWEAHKEPLVSLEARLEAARVSGLFYPGIKSVLQISNPAILAAQAEIAFVHNLQYREDGRRSKWQRLEQPNPGPFQLHGRTNNYLQRIMHASEDKHIPKADFALLAHCFQMPIRCWEASTCSVFESYLELARKIDLFAHGIEFLDFFRRKGESLTISEVPETPRSTPGLSQPELRVARTRVTFKRVRSNRDLIFSVAVPDDFDGDPVFVVLMEQDEDGVITLLSTDNLIDGDSRFHENVQIPRQEVVERREYAVALETIGTSKLYCVMSRADLSHLPIYRRNISGGSLDASSIVAEGDLALFRDELLQQSPEDWAVIRTVVKVD